MTLVTYITIIANFYVCSGNRDKPSNSNSHNKQIERKKNDKLRCTITTPR